MSKNLEILRAMVDNLPPFPECKDIKGDVKLYDMKEGDCEGIRLFQEDNIINVSRWKSSKGTLFPRHIHDSVEVIIVYKGSMNLTLGDGFRRNIVVGDHAYIPPKTTHKAHFPDDCEYVTITIPPAEGFP